MAIALLSHEVSDLTLGKPPLFWLPSSASVRDALVSLKLRPHLSEISVWCCPNPNLGSTCSAIAKISNSIIHNTSLPSSGSIHSPLHSSLHNRPPTCRCIGKICMLRLVCYLASDKSLRNLAVALEAPITVLLQEARPPSRVVQHLDPKASLLEALDAIADGAQNLVVQISATLKENVIHSSEKQHSMTQKHTAITEKPLRSKSHRGIDHCWLTHEDVMRFLLGYIGNFSPLLMMTIRDLGLITTDILMVNVEEEASKALDMIKEACHSFTAVAVVNVLNKDGAPTLVGEISSSTLHLCDETAALALATLSVGEFVSYTQDFRNQSMDFIESMCIRLCQKLELSAGSSKHCCQNLQEPLLKSRGVNQILQDLDMWEDSSFSSDNDYDDEPDSPTAPHELSNKCHLSHSSSLRMNYSPKWRSGPICCRPTSSLIAVIMQALAHRENYVWVTNDDDVLVGIVTFADIFGVLLNHINESY